MSSLIKEFKLEKKVNMIVVDGGANVCKAAELLEEEYPDLMVSKCACHILNNITKGILTDKLDEYIDELEDDYSIEGEDEEFKELINHILCQQFSDTVEKCKNLCNHFSHSVKSSELLKANLQKYCAMGYTKLIQPNITRWNSTFFCLTRILECKDALEYTFLSLKKIPDTKDFHLTEEDFKKIKLMINLLKPFQVASLSLQEEEVTYSKIVPSIVHIYYKLNVSIF